MKTLNSHKFDRRIVPSAGGCLLITSRNKQIHSIVFKRYSDLPGVSLKTYLQWVPLDESGKPVEETPKPKRFRARHADRKRLGVERQKPVKTPVRPTSKPAALSPDAEQLLLSIRLWKGLTAQRAQRLGFSLAQFNGLVDELLEHKKVVQVRGSWIAR